MKQYKKLKNLSFFDYANMLFLGVVALIMLFPFWNVVMTSFVSSQEFYTRPFILWPDQFVLDSYKVLFRSAEIGNAIMVTIFITLVGTAYSMLLTTSLAYGMTVPGLPGKKYIMLGIVMTMYFNTGMIPHYLLVKNLGMINTIWCMIIPAGISVWNFIVIRSFMAQLPSSLRESAMLDGANDLVIFIRIILPLSLPAIAAFTLFYAVGYWNTWWSATLFISNQKLQPLQFLLREMVVRGGKEEFMALGKGGAFFDTGIKMATVVVATVPILVLYPFLQRYFVSGITLGAVKG